MHRLICDSLPQYKYWPPHIDFQFLYHLKWIKSYFVANLMLVALIRSAPSAWLLFTLPLSVDCPSSAAALWIIFKLLPECRYVIITVCFSVCKSARLPENHWAGFYWTLCKSGAEWPEDPKWFCDWSGSLSLIMWDRWDGPWWRRPLSAVLVK